jgi:hypothetical protein
MTSSRVAWLAGADRLAHAVRGRLVRAECGVLAIEPRRAWPPRTRCGACLAALGQLPFGGDPTAAPRLPT